MANSHRCPRTPRSPTARCRPIQQAPARARIPHPRRTGRRPSTPPVYCTSRLAMQAVVPRPLIWIKNNIDPTLTLPPLLPRGRLRLVPMNIGWHQHARLHQGDVRYEGVVKIYPLPHMAVVKDLVPDMSNFYAQHAVFGRGCAPSPAPQRWRQSHGVARSSTAFTSASCVPAARPPARLLVEQRALPRPGRAAAGEPLAQRQPRRGDRRTARHSRGPVPALRPATPS